MVIAPEVIDFLYQEIAVTRARGAELAERAHGLALDLSRKLSPELARKSAQQLHDVSIELVNLLETQASMCNITVFLRTSMAYAAAQVKVDPFENAFRTTPGPVLPKNVTDQILGDHFSPFAGPFENGPEDTSYPCPDKARTSRPKSADVVDNDLFRGERSEELQEDAPMPATPVDSGTPWPPPGDTPKERVTPESPFLRSDYPRPVKP